MGRPYRFRNLITLFVIVIMLSSSFLTLLCFSILRALEILPNAFYATVWMPVTIVLVANVITACVHFIFVPKVIRPIEALISATGKVAKGDFSVRIDSKDQVGEIQKLSESFNAMAEELGGIEIFRSDFIRNFSHEFKTPIVSIAGFAKLVRRGRLTEEQKQEYLASIEEESMRLSYMATNVLNLTKVENQKILADVTKYNVSEQIRSAVLLLEAKWSKKNIDLQLEFGEYEIEANEELLKQVWINLIDNAVKFSPDGGTMVIDIADEEAELCISVGNTGDGIPQDKLDKIFHKFYQADESHAAEGNGIGLAIVKRVIALHGGKVEVRVKNGMTVFAVTLPKVQW